MNMNSLYLDSDTILTFIFWGFVILIILFKNIKKVPSGTVYIVDRDTHYHKTVKHGFFFFNRKTDKITTEISTKPKMKVYQNYFETEDGRVCSISFHVTYSAMNVEDVLYNLSSTRRSIDDVILSSMYHAVLSLKQKEVDSSTVEQEFQRNLYSQVLSLCIEVQNYKIHSVNSVSTNAYIKKVFKPHKSRSLSGGYDNYNV